MDDFKINRTKYYIFLSILIHFFIFLVTSNNKNIAQGDKIIPVEIIDNLIETGKGEETTRSERLINKKLLKSDSKVENKIESKIKNSSNKLNIQKDTLKTNIQSPNRLNQAYEKEQRGSGSREGLKNNEPEKGFLKGNGKIKITCLKCIRPAYPTIALRRGVEGKTVVRIWINTKGIVTQTKLITTSGIKSIDNAAIKAATASTFYPLDKKSIINIEYEMKIK
tara:strand:+ start:41 stop:709 length:669 start_codon:yes stop_codon:yes gene_type:complete